MEHTPETWEQQNWYVKAGDTTIAEAVARHKTFRYSPRYEELVQQDHANARRIVASVNFTAGLTTEYLEEHAGMHSHTE